MHPQAHFVEGNADGTQRWSSFERDEPIISMFYLGAIDVDSSPIDGHTLETRLAGFIDELALIGRAHNWDGTRLTAHGTTEQYDDGQFDRPSCPSGVGRRLFQSVKGHTLFAILTRELIDQAIKEFVWESMKKQVNDGNRESIKAILDKMIAEGESAEGEELDQLKRLNITPESQERFIQALSTKYGRQFTSEFLMRVKTAFALKEGETHVSQFYMTLENLFAGDPTKTAKPIAHGSQVFFQSESGGGSKEDEPPEQKTHGHTR
jgi:hypothetical protein